MSSLDKAASAFEADITGNPADGNGADTGNLDILFDHDHENDVEAGGDYEDDPEVVVDPDDTPEDIVEDDEDPDDEDGEEDEDNEDEEESVDPGSFDNTEFEVIVDGQPAKVTGKEMREGYIRTETFHQRLNKLHEAGTLVEQEARKVVENRNAYIAKLDEAEALITSLVPEEPDWDELFKTDPAKARNTQKTFESIQKTLEEVRSKRAQAVEESQREQDIKFQNWVRGEQMKIMANNPDWQGDEGQKKMQRDLSDMVTTAKAAGFSEDEIKNTHDSRMIAILKKAAAYDRLQRKRPTPVKRGKTPVNPGVGSVRTAPKGRNRAQDRLKRTGSLSDATAVFGDVLRNEKKRRG